MDDSTISNLYENKVMFQAQDDEVHQSDNRDLSSHGQGNYTSLLRNNKEMPHKPIDTQNDFSPKSVPEGFLTQNSLDTAQPDICNNRK